MDTLKVTINGHDMPAQFADLFGKVIARKYINGRGNLSSATVPMQESALFDLASHEATIRTFTENPEMGIVCEYLTERNGRPSGKRVIMTAKAFLERASHVLKVIEEKRKVESLTQVISLTERAGRESAPAVSWEDADKYIRENVLK